MAKSRTQTVYLFNCDKTFNLDSVETLLLEMNGECNFNTEVSFSCESNGGNLQNHYSSITNGFCGFCGSCTWISTVDQRGQRRNWLLEVLQSFFRRHWWVQQEISFFKEEDLSNVKKLIIHYRHVLESYKEMDLIRVRRQLDFQILLKDNNKPTFALCNQPLVTWYLHSMHMSRRSKRKFVTPERVSPLSHF